MESWLRPNTNQTKAEDKKPEENKKDDIKDKENASELGSTSWWTAGPKDNTDQKRRKRRKRRGSLTSGGCRPGKSRISPVTPTGR